MRYVVYILLIISVLAATGCSENPQENVVTNSYFLYEKAGLIDSIVGTCSTYLVRNFTLDTINFSGYDKAILEKDAYTDGDLSEILIYYLNADTAVTILHLQGKGQINSASHMEFQPPKRIEKYYLRMKLYSSVCTGQLFHLKLRDVKIYGVK